MSINIVVRGKSASGLRPSARLEVGEDQVAIVDLHLRGGQITNRVQAFAGSETCQPFLVFGATFCDADKRHVAEFSRYMDLGEVDALRDFALGLLAQVHDVEGQIAAMREDDDSDVAGAEVALHEDTSIAGVG